MPTGCTAPSRYSRIRCSPHLCRRSAGRRDSPDYKSGPSRRRRKNRCDRQNRQSRNAHQSPFRSQATRACLFEVNSRSCVDAGRVSGRRTMGAAAGSSSRRRRKDGRDLRQSRWCRRPSWAGRRRCGVRRSLDRLNPIAICVLHVAVFCASIPIYALSYVVGHIGLAHFSPRDVAIYTLKDRG
jgi:hypothetical protein